MKRSLLLLFACCLLSQWSMAQAPKWLDKTKKAVFSVVTYDKDNNILNTGNGFFVTATGVALSDYTLFKGADHAVIVDSDGKKLPVSAIMGANSMYDVIKFKVAVDKSVTYLTPAANPPAVGENVYLLPYATQKERLFTAGQVKEVAKAGEGHQFYTLTLKLGDKQVSCPVTNQNGEVFGIVQKDEGKDMATTCYAVGVSLAMALDINALSLNDITLNSIGIKKALPDTEEQALVFLFMASSQANPQQYSSLLDDFIEQYPNSTDGYIRRANNKVYTSKDASDIEKAIVDLNKALTISSDKDDIHYNTARLIYNYALSKPENGYAGWTQEKALEEVRKAQAINSLPVYKNLEGDILFAMQDYAGAYACYDEVSKTNIVSPAVFYSASRAKIMLEAGNEEILALMDSCIAHCPQPISRENAAYLLERAGLYMDMEKYRPAMLDYDEYEKAVNGAVNDVFYYYREQACMHARQYQRALDDIQKAIRMSPQNALYHTELGAINLRVGRTEESLKSLNEAIALSPEYAEPYRLRGVAYIQLKKKNEACEDFAKAKELGDPLVDSLIEKHCK